jgi:hypothetical protein
MDLGESQILGEILLRFEIFISWIEKFISWIFVSRAQSSSRGQMSAYQNHPHPWTDPAICPRRADSVIHTGAWMVSVSRGQNGRKYAKNKYNFFSFSY